MSLQNSSNDNTASNIPVILLVGKSGVGKSTLGNLLLGKNKFAVSDSADFSPQVCQKALIEINGKTFNIIEAPGVFDTNTASKEILEQEILQYTCGIQAFIFVTEATRFTKEQNDTIDQIINFFGQESLNQMIAVFSKCRKDQTTNRGQLFDSLNEGQKIFLNSIDNRFTMSPNPDIFGADDPIVTDRMKELKDYIVDIPNFYTTAAFKKVRTQHSLSNDTISNTPAILLIGKTGAGKSALGNLLLGKNVFAISDSVESTIQACKTAPIKINEKTFNLIEVPGVFDTNMTNEQVFEGSTQTILQCAYGIQAIIFVMEATRFTKEQKGTIDQVIEFLGQESLKHMIVVFSKCRKAQTINPDQLFNSLTEEQKTFLSSIDNKFTISPNLDIFEADDPIVTNHMKKLKDYIVDIPNFYMTDAFEKVRIAREKELQEIGENEHQTSNDEERQQREEQMRNKRSNAGLDAAKNISIIFKCNLL